MGGGGILRIYAGFVCLFSCNYTKLINLSPSKVRVYVFMSNRCLNYKSQNNGNYS